MPVADADGGKPKPRWRLGALVAIALAVAFVVTLWLATRTGDDVGAGPRIVTAQDVRAVPQEVGHPIYWAGERPGTDLELTVLPDRSVYVRYLPAGSPAGADDTSFTVATYPLPDAYDLVRRSSETEGAVTVDNPSGALVTSEGPDATNAYFAFSGTPLLMEVFDPEPGRALELVQSGDVELLQ